MSDFSMIGRPPAPPVPLHEMDEEQPASLKTGLPSWTDETPMETWYELTMWYEAPNGLLERLQEMQLTREEYVALKAHLARLRGYDKFAAAEVAEACHA